MTAFSSRSPDVGSFQSACVGTCADVVPRDWVRISIAWHGRMFWKCIALVLALCFAGYGGVSSVSAAAAVQPPAGRNASPIYADNSNEADTLLRSADSHSRDGQWEEAIGIYLRVIEQFGNKVTQLPKDDPLIPADSGIALYLSVKEFCQRRLMSAPPQSRALYRDRVDGLVRVLYEKALKDRDPALLRRIITESFCSSYGDDALERLGDWSFQDGHFSEAYDYYQRLLPATDRNAGVLRHPEPSVDLARAAAKALLARAALGTQPVTTAELDALKAAYPNSKVKLAGRTGSPADILAQVLKNDGWIREETGENRWPTFAGSPKRTEIASDVVEIGLGSFQWKLKLDPISLRNNGYNRNFGRPIPTPASPDQKLLAYHPIIVGDQVIFCNEQKVYSYPLNSQDDPDVPPSEGGAIVPKELWKSPPDSKESAPVAQGLLTSPPRFTLTAHGDTVFARLGPAQPVIGGGFAPRVANSAIVACDLKAQGKLLWTALASNLPLANNPEGGNFNAGFEGAPVCNDFGVFVGVTVGGGNAAMNQFLVVCLDPATGKCLWSRSLFDANAEMPDNMMFGGRGGMMMGGMGGNSSAQLGHRLLSLDGSTLYYQTNLGALVAIETTTGMIRWIATYPRNTDQNAGPRDLNPAVIHDGLVIVAPQDGNAILAFAAESGKLIWKTSKNLPLDDVAHVLGVAKGKLFVTGNHVYSIDVATGKLFQRWPENNAGYTGHGRGILAGDQVYWPTKSEIHVLEQSTGLRSRPPIKLSEQFQTTGGNLAVGDGFLVVAQEDQLVVYCQNKRLLKRYRDAVSRIPANAAGYYRLAQALERENDDLNALKSYQDAVKLAKPSDMLDGRALRDAARDQYYRMLMRLGRVASAAKKYDESVGRYREAIEAARTPQEQLAAYLRLSENQTEAAQFSQAVASLQAILENDALRNLTYATDENRKVRADLLIVQRLQEILKLHGKPLYAPFETAAKDLLTRGRTNQDTRALEAVGRIYPVSDTVPLSLQALGDLYAQRGRSWESGAAFKRLFALTDDPQLKIRGLMGLAASYEAQKLWNAARSTYAQLDREFGKQSVPDRTPAVTVADWVQRRLQESDGLRGLARQDNARTLPFPLQRAWSQRFPENRTPLIAEGSPPTPGSSKVFLVNGSAIQPLDPRTGASPWSAQLHAKPIWAGFLADRVLVATAERLIGINLTEGGIDWQINLSVDEPNPEKPNSPQTTGAGAGVKPQIGGNGNVNANANASANANANVSANANAKPIGSRAGDGRLNPFLPYAPRRKDDPENGKLQGFRIIGDRIYCFRGAVELLAIDGGTGLVDWTYAPATGTINAHYHVQPNRIVLQLRSPNSLLVLDPATGRKVAEFGQSEDDPFWIRDPLPLTDHVLGVVRDRLTVAALDIQSGQYAWNIKVTSVMPNYGPPLLHGDGNALLVVIDGRNLTRLDANNGKVLWSIPMGEENLSERPGAVAVSQNQVIHANDNAVTAVTLDSGAALWQQRLTGLETRWNVSALGTHVLAYPDPEAHRSRPNARDEIAAVICSRENGQFLQRFVFPAGGVWSVCDDGPRLLVATETAAWALGGPPAP